MFLRLNKKRVEDFRSRTIYIYILLAFRWRVKMLMTK